MEKQRPHLGVAGALVRGRGGRGFTLMEVMIVIVIILAIGGLVAVNLIGAKKTADTKLAQQQLIMLREALDQFYLDFNRYPSEEGEGLAALWNKDAITDEAEKAKWRQGGYTKEKIPRDQWGSEWIYHLTPADASSSDANSSGATSEYEIFSKGPDKQEGTDDDIYPVGKKPTEGADTGPAEAGPPTKK